MSSCCCVPYDCEGTTLREENVTARKTHRCRECNAEISTGTKHRIYVGTMDGRIYQARHCLPCAGICRDFFNCGFQFGTMRLDFFNCMGFDYLGEWPDA